MDKSPNTFLIIDSDMMFWFCFDCYYYDDEDDDGNSDYYCCNYYSFLGYSSSGLLIFSFWIDSILLSGMYWVVICFSLRFPWPFSDSSFHIQAPRPHSQIQLHPHCWTGLALPLKGRWLLFLSGVTLLPIPFIHGRRPVSGWMSSADISQNADCISHPRLEGMSLACASYSLFFCPGLPYYSHNPPGTESKIY